MVPGGATEGINGSVRVSLVSVADTLPAFSGAFGDHYLCHCFRKEAFRPAVRADPLVDEAFRKDEGHPVVKKADIQRRGQVALIRLVREENPGLSVRNGETKE